MKIGGGYSSSDSNYQSTRSRTLTPFQTALQPGLYATISRYMTDPMSAIRPQTQEAKNSVNSQYSGLADRLRSQFLTTGGGKSGKMGQAMLQGELARSGELADIDNKAAVEGGLLPLTAMQLAEQLLAMNFGDTAFGSGSQSGWNVEGGVGAR